MLVAALMVAALGLPALAQSGQLPQPSPAVAANQHLRDGMLAYSGGDFKKAIPWLKAALDELKAEPGFEMSVVWRVLVDNLGMAYGMSGDLKNAKATFDYGVSKDPNYPMFHYNLACTYAEMRDRDKAITELKEAFALKSNANPGESMPDPATDNSFARFLEDKTFVSALGEIRKAGRRLPDRLDFTASAVPWIVTIPAQAFQISQSKQSADGTQAYFMFTDEETGLVASIYIEPAVKCTDSKTCRDLVRSSNLPQVAGPENVSSFEIGAVSVFEYFLPTALGRPIRQQNLYAEFVQDGFWVDLHISKTLYKPEDHKLFEALVRSVTFEKKQ
jgi:tetratricopeptide (TPR) repeat protein